MKRTNTIYYLTNEQDGPMALKQPWMHGHTVVPVVNADCFALQQSAQHEADQRPLPSAVVQALGGFVVVPAAQADKKVTVYIAR